MPGYLSLMERRGRDYLKWDIAQHGESPCGESIESKVGGEEESVVPSKFVIFGPLLSPFVHHLLSRFFVVFPP